MLTQTLLHAIAQHSGVQKQGFEIPHFLSYQETWECYTGTHSNVTISTKCSSALTGVIQCCVRMEGATRLEATLKTMEANVSQLAVTTSFVGNAWVIQASEQLS